MRFRKRTRDGRRDFAGLGVTGEAGDIGRHGFEDGDEARGLLRRDDFRLRTGPGPWFSSGVIGRSARSHGAPEVASASCSRRCIHGSWSKGCVARSRRGMFLRLR